MPKWLEGYATEQHFPQFMGGAAYAVDCPTRYARWDKRTFEVAAGPELHLKGI